MERIAMTGNIFWIENDADVREIVTLLLSNHGITVHPFDDGRKALEEFRSDAVDLVLTDYHMPAMSGGELLSRIRERDPHTPVIILTANPDLEGLAASLDHEPFAVLPKPFQVLKLLQTVERGIRHKRQLRALSQTTCQWRELP